MTAGRKPTIREAGGFTAWLNGRLYPLLGPPPLGPYDAEVAPARACPLCTQPMDAHTIDRNGPRTQLYCPEAGPAASV